MVHGTRKGKRKERREVTVEREGGAQTQRWCDGHRRSEQVAERCACVFGSSSTLYQSSSSKSPSLRTRTNTQGEGSK